MRRRSAVERCNTMHYVGKVEVYDVAEIMDLGARFMGRGEMNVLMGAYPYFWEGVNPGTYWVSFSKDAACCKRLEMCEQSEQTRNWLALRIDRSGVDAKVILEFES